MIEATKPSDLPGAERSEAHGDLRQDAVARLETLEGAIRPVVDQAPDEVELFDLGVTKGDKPRLFIDRIAFVDLAHDRRTFRFFQDTRHGRVLIAQSERADRIVAAVTNYVARRLVEREQALAADWASRSAAADAIRAQTRAALVARPADPALRRTFWAALGDVFGFFLMTLGSVTFCVGLYLGLKALWEIWVKPLLGT